MSEHVLANGERTLRDAASYVVAARGDLARIQANLAADMERLRSQWGGQGAVAFAALHQAWQDKQSRVTRALDDFQACLETTERDFTATDQASADASQRLLSRLG